eukprot:scaffold3801_cov124-Skeletonema_dohrnii-CCMP3373.AAC.4
MSGFNAEVYEVRTSYVHKNRQTAIRTNVEASARSEKCQANFPSFCQSFTRNFISSHYPCFTMMCVAV